MKIKLFSAGLSVLLVFLMSCPAAPENTSVEYKSEAGPFTIAAQKIDPAEDPVLYADWIDSRDWVEDPPAIPPDDDPPEGTPIIHGTREIPVKIYAPDLSYSGTFPLILISHGLGGNVDQASVYIAEHLASYGYIVVSVQHHKSDKDYLNAWGTGSLIAAAAQQETRQLRPEDISFVLDVIENNTHGISLLTDRVNTGLIGILGHSFGAFTALAVNGMEFDDHFETDPRVFCGVAYSPQGIGTFGAQADSWSGITNSVMTMMGTHDVTFETPDAEDRRDPYDNMPGGNKYHATLLDAEHDDFGNIPDGFYHDWIKQMTIAFFDAYLLNESTALNWLNSGNIEALSGDYVNLESK